MNAIFKDKNNFVFVSKELKSQHEGNPIYQIWDNLTKNNNNCP